MMDPLFRWGFIAIGVTYIALTLLSGGLLAYLFWRHL